MTAPSQESQRGDARACSRYPEEVARRMASLYALGTLLPEENAELELHLSEGCAFCAEEVRESFETLAEVAKGSGQEPLPLEQRERMRRRIEERIAAPAEVQPWKSWGPQVPAGDVALRIVRGGSEGFVPTAAPGVTAKRLFVDPERRYVTILVRMQPGASYPSHRHAGHEECYVLEGDLHVGRRPEDPVLYAGDYQCATAESGHEVQWTEGGCFLLLVSSQDDELLD